MSSATYIAAFCPPFCSARAQLLSLSSFCSTTLRIRGDECCLGFAQEQGQQHGSQCCRSSCKQQCGQAERRWTKRRFKHPCQPHQTQQQLQCWRQQPQQLCKQIGRPSRRRSSTCGLPVLRLHLHASSLLKPWQQHCLALSRRQTRRLSSTAACVHVRAACGAGLDIIGLTKVLQLHVSGGGRGARTLQQRTCLFLSSDM